MQKYLNIELLQQLIRLSSFHLSPDGSRVVFSAARPNLEKNRLVENLYMLDLRTRFIRQLTHSKEHNNLRPRWRPDGRAILFLSNRSQSMQIWSLPADGGEAHQLTDIACGVDSFLSFPDGMSLAAVCSVHPGCQSLDDIKKRLQEDEERPVKMRVYDNLPFRRWDTWDDGRFSHILQLAMDGSLICDLTPEPEHSPAWSESGTDDYSVSPDSKEVCFVRAVGNEALDGVRELFIRRLSDACAVQLTTHQAVSFAPSYSPDGRYIAYLKTTRPLLDGCHPYLSIYDRASGKHTTLGTELDRGCTGFIWAPDSQSIWFTVEDRGSETIYRAFIEGKITRLGSISSSSGLQITPDGQQLIMNVSSLTAPPDLVAIDTSNIDHKEQLTNLNQETLEGLKWGEVSRFTYAGWGGEQVESWLIKPPDFTPEKAYPLLLLIHGGPHSAWGDNFHYRWNPQIFAAEGYLVIAPNFHGSSGYGQSFTDQLRGQWGGSAYEDLMLAVDEALKWPYTDANRLAAAGASYGGYMANWIAGHSDRFRCIVSHDGLYNLVTSIYTSDYVSGAMEELGGTPWENIEVLHYYSPSTYACNFKTPMLIIHGQLDYRVDLSDGLAMFQVLKARKIPAKLLYFPDENHWVLKPCNSIEWYRHVLSFLREWMA